MQYELNIHKGHALINDGQGAFLVDTGSEISLSSTGVINICGEQKKVPTKILTVSSEYISKNVGVEVLGLLGMDILGRYTCLIDYSNKILDIGYKGELGEKLPKARIPRVPSVANVLIDGKETNLVIDTGAPISYLAKDTLAGYPVVGESEDFNPLVEGSTFKTPLCSVPVAIGGKQWKATFGELPKIFSMLSLFGVSGVIGKEFFDRFQVILHEGSVYISPPI